MSNVPTHKQQIAIHVEQSETPDHAVLHVYRGARHWKRFESVRDSEDSFWTEDDASPPTVIMPFPRCGHSG